MALSKFILLLFFLVQKIFAVYCQNDQCASFRQENSTIKFQIINRSRFGFTVFSLAKENTFNSSYDCILYVEGTKINDYVLQNQGNFTLNNPIIIQDNLQVGIYSVFQLPTSNYLSFQGYDIYFNSTEFLSRFGDTFWVKLRLKSYLTVLYPTQFPLNFDEEYTFQANLSSFTGDIRWPPETTYKLTPMHPSWFTVNIVIYIGFIFLCTIFGGKQPLKSRGAIPYLALICQISMELSNLFIFIPLEAMQRDDVQLLSIYLMLALYLAALPTITFLEVLLFFRYLILMFLNKRKLLYKAGEKAVTISWYWRYLKISGHYGFNILFTIIFYIIIAGLIMLANYAGDDKYYIFYNLTIVTCSTIVAALFIIEFIANYKKETPVKHIILNIWKEDVLYFKSEVYIIGLVFLFPIFVAKFTLLVLNIQFYHLLVNTIMIYGIAVLQVVFPLTITIIDLIKNGVKDVNKKNEFQTILTDPNGLILIKKFSEYEFSSENIQCYEYIQKYKLLKTTEEREQFVNNFYTIFLNGTQSELEINVKGEECEIVKEKITKKEIDEHTLDEIEKAIKTNISDTFQRFRHTGEYYKYLQEKDITKEI